MTDFYGADTRQLRTHADLLRDRATALQELQARLEPVVLDEEMWKGPDADHFRSDWMAQAASKFRSSITQLQQWNTDLSEQAEEQDTASDDVEGATGGTIGGGTGSGNPGGIGGIIHAVQDFWNQHVTGPAGLYAKVQGLFQKGKKIWDIAGDMMKHGELDKLSTAIAGRVFGNGKEFSDFAKGIAGKLGIPQGFGNKNFFNFLDGVAEKVPFLSKAAPWVGKALPGIDIVFGGKQLIESIGKGDTFHAVTGGAQTVGGALMLAGGAMSATGVGAVAGAPIAAVGAVISGGAALADLGKLAYDHRPEIGQFAHTAWNTTTSAVGHASEAVGSLVHSTVSNVSDSVSSAVSHAQKSVNNVVDGIAGAWSRAFG